MDMFHLRSPTPPLPWWAVETPSLATDSFHVGYFARNDNIPFDATKDSEWKDGWNQCDSEIAHESEKAQ